MGECKTSMRLNGQYIFEYTRLEWAYKLAMYTALLFWSQEDDNPEPGKYGQEQQEALSKLEKRVEDLIKDLEEVLGVEEIPLKL